MKLAVRILTVLAVSAGLIASPAAAQAKKKADPKAAAGKAADAKAAAAKKPEERKGPAKLDGKETPKIEDVEKEANADKKRDEQIEAAKKIIPKIEDGNPTKAMGIIAHPGEIAAIDASFDGQSLITAGREDMTVAIWSVDTSVVDREALAAPGIEPYVFVLLL